MEDITLTALKSLYRIELKELELMQEYAAEKETTLYSLAVDILREVGKEKEQGIEKSDFIKRNQILEEKSDTYFERSENMININFKESLAYDLQKAFVLKIEHQLREIYKLTPEKDLQGNITFKTLTA